MFYWPSLLTFYIPKNIEWQISFKDYMYMCVCSAWMQAYYDLFHCCWVQYRWVQYLLLYYTCTIFLVYLCDVCLQNVNQFYRKKSLFNSSCLKYSAKICAEESHRNYRKTSVATRESLVENHTLNEFFLNKLARYHQKCSGTGVSPCILENFSEELFRARM